MPSAAVSNAFRGCDSCLQVENWDHMERFWQQAVHRQALHSDEFTLPA